MTPLSITLSIIGIVFSVGVGAFFSLFFTDHKTVAIWILCATIIVVLILSFFLWHQHIKKDAPDTYICLFGQEYAYPLGQSVSVTLKPVQFPEGVSETPMENIPLKSFRWTYPENTKLYTLVVDNRGGAIDKNVTVSVHFPYRSTSIRSIKIDKDKEVSLIEGGGLGASYATFKIYELLPGVKQSIEIVTQGTDIESIRAWSETQQEIGMVYIFDVVFEPIARLLTYTDTDNGFSIAYPEDWAILQKDKWYGALLFVTAQEACGGYHARFDVCNEELSQDVDLATYANTIKSQLQQLEGYTFISEKKLTMSNIPAIKLISTHESENIRYKHMQVCLVDGTRGWVLSFITVTSCWEQYEGVFNIIEGRFNLFP